MWWRLGVLAAVTGALLLLLLAPMATVAIKVDLPPGSPSVSTSQVQIVAEQMVWNAVTFVVAAILAIAGWIAWRIVRRHRASN